MGSWVHAHRMLVALDEAHLLAVEILQIRVSLPLSKVLGQAHHPPHDFSAPSEIHVVARVHCHPVQEGRPFVIGPQPVVNLPLLTIVSPTRLRPQRRQRQPQLPRATLNPSGEAYGRTNTRARKHGHTQDCDGNPAPAARAAAAAPILHTCSLI